MKLIIVCPPLAGNGGIETVLVKFVNFFSKKYDVSIILVNDPKNKVWLKQIDSHVQININNFTKLQKIKFLMKLFVQGKKDDTFIILKTSYVQLACLIRKCFLKKYKVISWIHFYINKNQATKLKNADQNWAISSNIKQSLLEAKIPSEKIKLIFNPVSKNNKLSLPKDDKFKINLVYIGRIQYLGQKNMQELLHAVKILKNVKLDIYGSGEQEDINLCKRFCDINNLNDRIIWHGWFKDPWKELKYSPSAIVLTSKIEGFPMVILESLSRGIPVLVSRFEGYEDIVIENENGMTYSVGNLQMLVSQVKKLESKKFDANSIQSSIERFYDKKYYSKLDKILNNINQK